MIITELSADVRLLADHFAGKPVGDTATYDDMTKLIGRDIRRVRYLISSARRVALREAGIVMVVDRGAGYRRIAAADVADVIGATARAHIRRSARHGRKIITEGTARANDLPAAVQRRIAAEVSALSLVEHVSRDNTVAPADDAPIKPQPVAVTAQRFLEAIGGKAA